MTGLRRLRVLQICHDYEGPFVSVCRQYVGAFADADVTTVFLRGAKNPDVAEVVGGRVVFLDLPPLRGIKLRSILAVSRWTRGQRHDVVVAHRYKPIYVAGILSYFCDFGVILAVAHEHDVFARPTRALFVTFWRPDIFVIAVSRTIADNVMRHCPSVAADGRLAVLGHAVAEIALLDRDSARAHLGLPKSGFVLGCVGRLIEKKRHDLAIKAFARSRAADDCSLVLLGDGRSSDALIRIVRDLGLSSRVVFLGHVVDAVRYLKAFDCFVFPSGEAEAFGIALVEAMLAGLPIVASNAAGPAEVLGPVGLRFEVDDVDSLASRIDELINMDDDQRAQLGTVARQRFEDEYRQEQFTARLRALGPLEEMLLG